MFVNPVQNATNAFLAIWEYLPFPIKSLFFVSLFLTVIYGLYKLLSR